MINSCKKKSKQRLLGGCKQLKIPCKSSMSKQILCEMLNKHVNLSTNLDDMPKDIKYKILVELPIGDLAKMCQTNKKYQEICNNDEFWRRKLIFDFPEYLKPENLNHKEWYDRIINSGNLYSTEFPNVLVAENVYKCYPIDEDHLFYIDMYYNLYFMGDIYSHIQRDLGELYSIIEQNWKNKETSVKVLEEVVDIFVGYYDTVILTVHGEIYNTKEDSTFVYQRGNIKSLIFHITETNHCLLISTSNNLYISENKGKFSLKFIASNVQMATFGENKYGYVIYYVTMKGELYEYYPIRINGSIIIDKPGDNGLQYDDYEIKYEHKLLIKNSVKSIQNTKNYLLILDINSKMWIYLKSRFHNDFVAEYDKHQYTEYGDSWDDTGDEGYRRYEENEDDDDEANTQLAGFNQSTFNKLKFRQIITGYNYNRIGLVDTKSIFYVLNQNKLEKNVLFIKEKNVISCFIGYTDYYIKNRTTSNELDDDSIELDDDSIESDE